MDNGVLTEEVIWSNGRIFYQTVRSTHRNHQQRVWERCVMRVRCNLKCSNRTLDREIVIFPRYSFQFQLNDWIKPFNRNKQKPVELNSKHSNTEDGGRLVWIELNERIAAERNQNKEKYTRAHRHTPNANREASTCLPGIGFKLSMKCIVCISENIASILINVNWQTYSNNYD